MSQSPPSPPRLQLVPAPAEKPSAPPVRALPGDILVHPGGGAPPTVAWVFDDAVSAMVSGGFDRDVVLASLLVGAYARLRQTQSRSQLRRLLGQLEEGLGDAPVGALVPEELRPAPG